MLAEALDQAEPVSTARWRTVEGINQVPQVDGSVLRTLLVGPSLDASLLKVLLLVRVEELIYMLLNLLVLALYTEWLLNHSVMR